MKLRFFSPTPRSTFFLLGLGVSLLACTPSPLSAADVRTTVEERVRADYPHLETLYRWFHANPELSFREEKSAQRLASEWRASGLDVTERVGGHGVVGVLRQGAGPTVLLRTDLDALPVQEQTGLPYASQARMKDDAGNDMPVMHACGHDVHMTCLTGVARVLAGCRERWSGTLVFIGQPAEERVAGAKAMLHDGLFTRFPKPDFCLAIHVMGDLAAGTLGYTEGFSLANVDAVDITVRGVGGHGAAPHKAKDPVVLAAEIVMALQTIVSREVNPVDPAVVTVGTIHGGTKRNIIPEEVKMQLTLRSYSDEVREQLVKAIGRICDGLGRAAGLPEDRLPVVTRDPESVSALYNDPPLTRRVVRATRAWFGDGNVLERKPIMGAEDFSVFGRTPEKIPLCMFFVGTASRESFEANLHQGKPLPSIHSPYFAPAAEPSIQTGVTAMTAAVLELVGRR